MIYQRKPVYVDAFLLTGDNSAEANVWLRKRGVTEKFDLDFEGYLSIKNGRVTTYDKKIFEKEFQQL